MNTKTFVTAALALFFIGTGVSFAVAYVFDSDETTIENQQAATVTAQQTNSDADKTNQAQQASDDPQPAQQSNTPATSPTSTPAPAPAPKPVLACGNGGPCTSAEVAKHSSANDCWGIYQGKVFNLTSYVPKHDGGAAAFNNQSCGGDMTSYLNGSSGSGGIKAHRHSQNAYSILNSYYIADLK